MCCFFSLWQAMKNDVVFPFQFSIFLFSYCLSNDSHKRALGDLTVTFWFHIWVFGRFLQCRVVVVSEQCLIPEHSNIFIYFEGYIIFNWSHAFSYHLWYYSSNCRINFFSMLDSSSFKACAMSVFVWEWWGSDSGEAFMPAGSPVFLLSCSTASFAQFVHDLQDKNTSGRPMTVISPLLEMSAQFMQYQCLHKLHSRGTPLFLRETQSFLHTKHASSSTSDSPFCLIWGFSIRFGSRIGACSAMSVSSVNKASCLCDRHVFFFPIAAKASESTYQAVRYASHATSTIPTTFV